MQWNRRSGVTQSFSKWDNPVGKDAIDILSLPITGLLVFAVGYFVRGLSSRKKAH